MLFALYFIFHSVSKNLSRYSLLFPLVLLTGVVCITGCGQKNTDGRVRINGTVMLDGSPLICEGEGESYVNLVSETGENGGGSGSFDRSTGAFEMTILPGNYKAVIRATDGFMIEDEKRGRVTPAKSLIPEKYSSSDDTDVTVTVSPSGGEVSIQLSSE